MCYMGILENLAGYTYILENLSGLPSIGHNLALFSPRVTAEAPRANIDWKSVF